MIVLQRLLELWDLITSILSTLCTFWQNHNAPISWFSTNAHYLCGVRPMQGADLSTSQLWKWYAEWCNMKILSISMHSTSHNAPHIFSQLTCMCASCSSLLIYIIQRGIFAVSLTWYVLKVQISHILYMYGFSPDLTLLSCIDSIVCNWLQWNSYKLQETMYCRVYLCHCGMNWLSFNKMSM